VKHFPSTVARVVEVVLVAATLVAGCDSQAGFPDARIPDAAPVPGTFSLSWTLTDTSDSLPISCDDANAQSISITVREADASSGQTEVFNCSSGSATSRPYPPGTYVLGFELRGSAGQIATAPSQNGIVVTSSQDTPIGAIDFSMVGNGMFSATVVAATASMSNCGPIAGMGGGIDQMTLTLTKDAACVPFDYTVNATPFTTTCPATPVACIERTDDIVSATLDSGRYQLEAVGLIAGAACWVGAREVRIPTGGGTLTTSLAIAYQPLVSGCPAMP